MVSTIKHFYKMYLFPVLHPRGWIQSDPTCLVWDKVLLDLINNPKNVNLGKYITIVDGVGIWTSNFPYAYGRCRSDDFYPTDFLPTLHTRYILRKKINEWRGEYCKRTMDKRKLHNTKRGQDNVVPFERGSK